MTSAAFWKLREVSLSYDVPVKNILGGAIKAAEIGIVGRNLLMLRPKTNVWTDPEFNFTGRIQQRCWLYERVSDSSYKSLTGLVLNLLSK